MALRHHLKKVGIFLGTAVVLVFMSNMCLAADIQVSGTISTYHLNLQLSANNLFNVGKEPRGVCIQMVPALPTTWICTYGNDSIFALFTKMNDVLWDAYNQHRTCTIGYNDCLVCGLSPIQWPAIGWVSC
jgi:hypothetical protein